MAKIAIHLPPLDTDDKVEVEVRVNGKRRTYMYRMELFAWEEYAEPDEERAECLKRVIKNYDKSWQLIEIGEPSDREVSILFERKTNAPEVT